MRADRIIAIQADGHAQIARHRLRPGELFVREPLKIEMEFHARGVLRREPLRRIHECVFGVLALESEPVDPRL